MSHPILACRDVCKLYGPKAERFVRDGRLAAEPSALAEAGVTAATLNVSLEIERGETFVIMGLSGSGKSTLVRILSGLTPPTAGVVLFEDRDLASMSEHELIQIRRHQMGMVFQHFALLPHLTVLGNVAFPLEIQGRPKAEREARAREMISLVGLDGREGRFPRELSGGQQQRVGIARSLAVEPELWFLDEPFSALDPLIRREMQDEFMRLQSVLKKTIVFITHDFDEAIRLADRIAIMKDGAIVQAGTPEDIVLNPADPYVAEFTRNVARSKVVRTASLMRSLDGGAQQDITAMVSARATIAEAAPLFSETVDRMRVIDRDGSAVGILDSAAVVELMMQG